MRESGIHSNISLLGGTVANKRVQFAISDGQLVPAISVDEMLEVERVADEETGPSLLQMMEHAGLELAITALGMLGES